MGYRFGAAFLWTIQALYFYVTGSDLGFPDGGLTELARARKPLYPVFAAFCLLAAVVTFALGRRRPFRKLTFLVLPVVGASLWAIDFYLAMSLDDGRGG